MSKLFIIVSIFVLGFGIPKLEAQIKGEESPEYNPDTLYIYTSPRPLINQEEISGEVKQAWGLDLLFSGNGFGLGLFYQKAFTEDLFAFASFYISGAKNTDEFELYDYNTGQFFILDKINRLFMFPLTLGIQQYLFRDVLNDNLKPFINIGLGPSFILSTPYEKEFFSSFGDANAYTRFGAFIGGGANVGSGSKSFVSVNVRYYFIPFGGEGLESVKNNPIKDFGGLFLSLSLGAKF